MELKELYSASTIIVICTIIATIQAASAVPVISIEPSYQSVSHGDTFTVNITVDPDGNEISGVDYGLSFDNTLLNATSLTPGTFFDGFTTDDTYGAGINNTTGTVDYGEMVWPYTGTGATDPGTVTTITFQVIGEHVVSELYFVTVALSDPDGNDFSNATIYNGRVGIAQPPPTSFLICGYVSNDDGSECNDPAVNITNMDIGKEWAAKTDASSNYYQLTLSSCADVIAGDVLQFDTTGCSHSNTTSHTVTQAEVGAGGFECNITLGTAEPDTTPPVITDVANGTPTANSVTITWTTDEASDSLVKYGTVSGTYTDDISDAARITAHSIGLSGLTPETTYYFVVNSTDASDNSAESAEHSFTTAAYIPPSTTVSIEAVTVASGGNVTVPIMVNYVTDLGGCEINMVYNASVVHVTDVTQGDMDLLVATFDNGIGWMYASAINATGLSGNVVFAYVNFTAVGGDGDTSPLNITVKDLFDVNFSAIDHTVINGTFTIGAEDGEPPLVTDASASMDTILNDNGRPRALGTNVTVLNVTVTDGGSGVANVTINLSSIGGSPVQPMVRIGETDIWTVTTNATAGINLTHQLTINATDNDGNYNNTVAIQLIVLRRGDVCRDDTIDHKDVMYIARYLAGLEPESSNPPTVLVGDVVGVAGDPEGDGAVNLMDALYIARYGASFEIEP